MISRINKLKNCRLPLWCTSSDMACLTPECLKKLAWIHWELGKSCWLTSFANKCIGNPRFRNDWFPEARRGRNTRQKTHFHKEYARCEHLKNSPVFYMRKRLNRGEGKRYGKRQCYFRPLEWTDKLMRDWLCLTDSTLNLYGHKCCTFVTFVLQGMIESGQHCHNDCRLLSISLPATVYFAPFAVLVLQTINYGTYNCLANELPTFQRDWGVILSILWEHELSKWVTKYQLNSNPCPPTELVPTDVQQLFHLNRKVEHIYRR